MPKTRTITATTAGTDAALKAAVATTEPKRASLGQLVKDAFLEMPGTALALVNLQKSTVGVFLSSAATAVNAAFAGIGGDLATFTPSDPTLASATFVLTGGGYVAAVEGHPDYWTSDGGSGAPADVDAVAAVAEADPFGLFAAVKPGVPALTVASLISRIEDAMALTINAGKSALILVDQTLNLLKVRVVDSTVAQNSTATSATTGIQAEFLGTVTDSTGTARQFGE